MENKRYGIIGEKIAENYLTARSYEIIAKNWTCKWGELDIVSAYEGKIVFVEVKLRNSTEFGEPAESLNSLKIRHLKRTINLYLKSEDCFNLEWSLDAIFVTREPNYLYKVSHFKNILSY